MSADSLEVWSWASGTPATDWHPPLYLFLMTLSQLTVGSPAGLAAAQCLMMGLGLAVLSRRVAILTGRIHLAWGLAAAIAVSPMYGAFSISLWKDVPFTAVALVIAERLLVILTSTEHRHRVALQLAALCVLLVLLRQNGVIFVAAIGLALLVARTPWRLVAAIVALPVVALGVAKTVVYPAAHIAPAPATLTFAPTFLDVGAVAHADPAELTEFQAASIAEVQPLEAWVNGYSCETVNPLIFNTTFDAVGLEDHSTEYLAAWLSIVAAHPGTVLRSRLCTADPAYAPGPFGQRADLYTVSLGVDPNELGLKTEPILDAPHDWAVSTLRWLDDPSREWLFWRAPLAAYLLAAAWVVQRIRGRNAWHPMVVAFPLLFLVSAGVLSIAPDARYTFGALLAAVALFPVSLGPKRAAHHGGETRSASLHDELPVPAATDGADPQGGVLASDAADTA